MTSSKQKLLRLQPKQTTLAIVDIQERLVPAMHDRDLLVQKAVQLIRGCTALGVSMLVTEQYPLGLGHTVKEVAGSIQSFSPIEKLAFSACGAPAFVDALKANKSSTVIVAGIEAHVCVTQTCLDLLEGGWNVFLAADATSSRRVDDCRLGLERAREAGAVIGSVEMALFEMMRSADSPHFKQILQIVK